MRQFCFQFSKMAAKRAAAKGSLDSQDFDAEFEKFMNEPLSDESHTVTTPRNYRKGKKFEKSGTQESLENILSDEFLTTESKSPSPAEKKHYSDDAEDINEKRYKEQIKYGQSSISESDAKDEGKKSDMTGTLEFDSTLKTLKDEMMRDSRHHPEQSFDGMDTLEELADKEKFFNKLAVDVSGTLDFAKLNKALDEAQSDPEKSDDHERVLVSKAGVPSESVTKAEVQEPDTNHSSTDDLVARIDASLKKKHIEQMVDEYNTKEMGSVTDYKSIEKDSIVNESNETHHSEYDSESPPSESLRSIKEVAQARMKEVKERNREKMSATQNESNVGSKEQKSSLSKLPKPISGHKETKQVRKSSKSKEMRRRGSTQRSSISSTSSSKESSATGSSTKSVINRQEFKPHGNIKTFSDIHLQFSGDFSSMKASQDAVQLSKSSALAAVSERELPIRQSTEISRELQLQSELYDLRADFNRIADENEQLQSELKRITKSSDRSDMKLRHEFELEQLKQKNLTLEKQLKKAKDLHIKHDEDIGKETASEVLQIKKELQEQEMLLNGYQLENERLFKELKRRDAERKQFHSTVIDENQRLKSTLAELEKRCEDFEKQVKDLMKEKSEWKKSEQHKNEGINVEESRKKLTEIQAENDELRRTIEKLKEKTEKDAKVIKDLERQNHEMETILKRRYPDSVPDILDERKSVPLKADKILNDASKTVEFLERQNKRLEKELDVKDEETAQLLAASEIRYREMSEVYEKHISSLQKQLGKAIAKQKAENRERRSPKRTEMDRDVLMDEGIVRKTREYKDTLEDSKQNRRKTRKINEKEIEHDALGSKMHRSTSPVIFKDDAELKDVKRENVELKLRLDDLKMSYEEMKVRKSAALATVEAELSKMRSNTAAEIEELKRIHNNKTEAIKESQLKYEETISKLQDEISRLEKKLIDYDFVTEKLKEKSLEAAVDKELLQAAKLKEDVLQNQVKLLQKQLKDAIECQPPSQQRLTNIEMQLSSIHQRQLDRENEINKLVRTTRPRLDVGRDPGDVDWGRIVEAKDVQIKQFRDELDEILKTLHSLYANRSMVHVESIRSIRNGNTR